MVSARQLAAFFALSLTAWGQTVSSGAEERIRTQMFGGSVSGIALKEQSRMGDTAAVLIGRVIDGQTLSATHIGAILSIVHVAFGRPAALENVSDREPKQTLLLLQQLDRATKDARLKAQIADEGKFVLDQFAMASAKDSPDCMLANFSAARTDTNFGYRLTKVYLSLTEASRRRHMGDAVADYLQTIVGDCTLRPDDARNVLEVIRFSFARPQAIPVPTKVLTLLERLDASTVDASLKAEIAETRASVLGPPAAPQ
jgi:hypothetical protein